MWLCELGPWHDSHPVVACSFAQASVALIRRETRHRRSSLMAAVVFVAFACRQSAGRPMAERVANQACCRSLCGRIANSA